MKPPNEAVQPIGESKGRFRLWLTSVLCYMEKLIRVGGEHEVLENQY